MQKPSNYYRFCPGEEEVRISDAICLGRRRASYPKCHGCPFSDDQGAEGHPSGGHGVQGTNAEVFKANDIRGVYPEPLNEELAWRIGHATAQFLRSALTGYDRSDPELNSVVVGRDMRKSSPALAGALIEGLRAAGAGVIDVGMIDTSQIYFAVNHLRCCGGVQTTASHNPAQYNGFKICGKGGRPIGQDTGLQEVARIAMAMTRHETGVTGPLRQVDLTQPYKAFIRQFLQPTRDLKVVIDASNGMAGKWFDVLFADAAHLDTAVINPETTGEFVHDPNPLVDANLAQLQKEVLRRKADMGICFDGDADRCVFVDSKGKIVRCDTMTALLARTFLEQHPGSTIVYDLRSSRVVREEIEAAGGVPRRERVGHAFMKKTLADTKAVFGGEVSGHFYFRDNWYCDSGFLAFVHSVNVLGGQRKSLASLVKPLQRYAGSGERNFSNDDKDGTVRALAEKYSDGEVDFLDGATVQYEDWWFNVRPSNTEPLLRLIVEAVDARLLKEKLTELTPQLGEPVEH
ncbi:MAG TPA: phosphomannomutase/phosphoglucomutase [Phycisphaerae bacterium]|nr:phosphomannomutase/phosphoglucomutase [Phycisphaerae bacterium]